MILSQYRNPPYRMPLHKEKVASPPPGHSPKRKRLEPAPPLNPPRLQTSPDDEFRTNSGADSPRSKVAERFQGLTIDRPQSPGSPSLHKRLKWTVGSQRETDEREDIVPTPLALEKSDAEGASVGPGNRLKVLETPGSRLCSLSVDRPNLVAVAQESESPTATVTAKGSISTKNSQGSVRLSSPPPPTPAQTTVDATSSHSSDLTASNSSPDSSPDRAALTWQDNEITGHDIDSTTGDDDGEGINGIGFKPTAAIAYARSQRRKQQVSEWRAREAREARQRRFERRRGTAMSGRRSDPVVRRVVRFEGVG